MKKLNFQFLFLVIYVLTISIASDAAPALGIPGKTPQPDKTISPPGRPNILFVISDDQGYPYASAYGTKFVNTPNFDRIARNGILFTHFFVSAPQCSPSRASILTGQQIWQNGPAGTHFSTFPAGLTVYTDILKNHGYKVGYTGKGWGPGSWKDGKRKTNPAGKRYDAKDKRYTKNYPEKRFASRISRTNYAASFKKFLSEKDKNTPFCFWFGGHEPHLPWEKGSGLRRGKSLDSVNYVPEYLPDNDVVKSDLLDYAVEIEWFDTQVGRALAALKNRGELKNTLVIFIGDNGAPLPRAKALSFDAGTHTPLAIMWKNGPIKNPERTVDDLISGVDFFPTILQAAGLKKQSYGSEGKSLLNIFKNGKVGITDSSRKYIYWGRERHGNARWHNFGYPQRAIRSHKYLYIWNLTPERWPVGSPKRYGKNDSLIWSFYDTGNTPTKKYIIEQRVHALKDKTKPPMYSFPSGESISYYKMDFGKFPEEMLYNVQKDPYCLHNLADKPKYQKIKKQLSSKLKQKLRRTNDPRLGKTPNVWNAYRRYGRMFRYPEPDWAKKYYGDH